MPIIFHAFELYDRARLPEIPVAFTYHTHAIADLESLRVSVFLY
jgi:hypothetical protein